MMAPPAGRTHHLHGLKVAIIFTVAFVFSLTFLLPKSGGSELSERSEGLMKERKAVIGSKPPACVNKCMNCRPCMATVVVPNHRRKGLKVSSHDKDDSYYLLSWKCRCGNKLFHP